MFVAPVVFKENLLDYKYSNWSQADRYWEGSWRLSTDRILCKIKSVAKVH